MSGWMPCRQTENTTHSPTLSFLYIAYPNQINLGCQEKHLIWILDLLLNWLESCIPGPPYTSLETYHHLERVHSSSGDSLPEWFVSNRTQTFLPIPYPNQIHLGRHQKYLTWIRDLSLNWLEWSIHGPSHIHLETYHDTKTAPRSADFLPKCFVSNKYNDIQR